MQQKAAVPVTQVADQTLLLSNAVPLEHVTTALLHSPDPALYDKGHSTVLQPVEPAPP
jgi:hypothetical protein